MKSIHLFNKVLLSNELCEFLSVPYGTEQSPIHVYKTMCWYFRKHRRLQHRSFPTPRGGTKIKTVIVLDKKLNKLVPNEDYVIYTSTFDWLRRHFKQPESPELVMWRKLHDIPSPPASATFL